eukprot:COSAG06_NODE_1260_length_10074_cov_127.640000_4_plen_106_part_00
MLRRGLAAQGKTRSPLKPTKARGLLTATPGEAATLVACAPGGSTDLPPLAVACRRFALKCIARRTTTASRGAATARMKTIAGTGLIAPAPGYHYMATGELMKDPE